MIRLISEPDVDVRTEKFSRMREHFLAGRIGEWTFRASLQNLGLCPMDISAEVHLAKMEMQG